MESEDADELKRKQEAKALYAQSLEAYYIPSIAGLAYVGVPNLWRNLHPSHRPIWLRRSVVESC